MIEAYDEAFRLILCERASALQNVRTAIKLIENIHNHHFSCRQALSDLRSAETSISAIKLAGEIECRTSKL